MERLGCITVVDSNLASSHLPFSFDPFRTSDPLIRKDPLQQPMRRLEYSDIYRRLWRSYRLVGWPQEMVSDYFLLPSPSAVGILLRSYCKVVYISCVHDLLSTQQYPSMHSIWFRLITCLPLHLGKRMSSFCVSRTTSIQPVYCTVPHDLFFGYSVRIRMYPRLV